MLKRKYLNNKKEVSIIPLFFIMVICFMFCFIPNVKAADYFVDHKIVYPAVASNIEYSYSGRYLYTVDSGIKLNYDKNFSVTMEFSVPSSGAYTILRDSKFSAMINGGYFMFKYGDTTTTEGSVTVPTNTDLTLTVSFSQYSGYSSFSWSLSGGSYNKSGGPTYITSGTSDETLKAGVSASSSMKVSSLSVKQYYSGNSSISTMPTAKRGDYNTNAWYLDAAGTSRVTSIPNLNSNYTLYSRWNIPAPSSVTISGEATKVYNSSQTILTCAVSPEYSTSLLYYSFGYATSNGGTPSNWTTANTTNTLIIPQNEPVGQKWYSCRAYAYANSNTSGTTTSLASADAEVTINNAKMTFDANGETITESGQATRVLYSRYGDPNFYTTIRGSTIENTLPTATKSNYIFDGWYTESSGGDKVINADGTVVESVDNWTDADKKFLRTEDSTLYAQFVPSTYTISYNLNGGTSNAPTTGQRGTDVVINNPTKPLRIYGNANGTGAITTTTYENSAPFLGWTSTTLGPDAKTGTSDNPTDSWDGTITKNRYYKDLTNSGETVNLVANWETTSLRMPVIHKDGYTCNWNTNADGSGTSYEIGDSYTFDGSTSSTSITVYAQCEESDNVITFDYQINSEYSFKNLDTGYKLNWDKKFNIATGVTHTSYKSGSGNFYYPLLDDVTFSVLVEPLFQSKDGWTRTTGLTGFIDGQERAETTTRNISYKNQLYSYSSGWFPDSQTLYVEQEDNNSKFISARFSPAPVSYCDGYYQAQSCPDDVWETKSGLSSETLKLLPNATNEMQNRTKYYHGYGYYNTVNPSEITVSYLKISYEAEDNETINSLPEPKASQKYTFDGWYDAPEGGNKITSITVDESKTLYAHWTSSYSVTLDNQEASQTGTQNFYYTAYSSKVIDDITCYYFADEEHETCISNDNTITVPTKEHYTFDGYYSEPNGAGTKYINNSGTILNDLYYKAPYEINANNTGDEVTLYANWIGDPITVTYPDGEEETYHYGDPFTFGLNTQRKPNETATVTFKYEDNVTDDTTGTVTKSYTPNGWKVGSTEYSDNEVITLTDDITIDYNYTETITGPEFPAPTRDNYVFEGWYDGEGNEVTSYANLEDTTLYAHWSGAEITVTKPDDTTETKHYGDSYNLETNEEAKADETATVTFKYQDSVTDDTTGTVVKSFTPNGWLVNGVEKDDDEVLTLTEDITIRYNYEETVTGPAFPEPTREHYTFDGWYDSEDNKITSYTELEDITLYAHWIGDEITVTYPDETEEIYNYGDSFTFGVNTQRKPNENGSEITFKYQDGETDDTTANVVKRYTPNGWKVGSTEYSDNEVITLTENITIEYNYTETLVSPEFPYPTKEGYSFMGWYTEEDDGERLEEYTGDDDINLYARFTIQMPQPPSISPTTYKIYGSEDTTLTCSTSTEYGSGINVYYQFATMCENYDDDMESCNWTEASTNNTYLVKSTEYIGSRLYVCRVYATDGVQTSEMATMTGNYAANVEYTNVQVTLDATEGKVNGSDTDYVYFRYGESNAYDGSGSDDIQEVPSAVKEEFVFTGWYTEEEGGQKVINKYGSLVANVENYTNESGEWILLEDTTLYAHWSISTDAETFELDTYELELDIGETYWLGIQLIPEGTYDSVLFSDYDNAIISVTEDGLITALSSGTTTITATLQSNPSITKTVEVTVLGDDEEELTSEELTVKERTLDGNEYRIIVGEEPNVELEDFLAKLDNERETLRIFDKDGEVITNTEGILTSTGMVVKLVINDNVLDEAIVIVRGDINEDGLVDAQDKARLKNHLLGKDGFIIDDYRAFACDLVEDSEAVTIEAIVNAEDNARLANYLLGKPNSDLNPHE